MLTWTFITALCIAGGVTAYAIRSRVPIKVNVSPFRGISFQTGPPDDPKPGKETADVDAGTPEPCPISANIARRIAGESGSFRDLKCGRPAQAAPIVLHSPDHRERSRTN